MPKTKAVNSVKNKIYFKIEKDLKIMAEKRVSLGVVPLLYPAPVLLVGTYDENGQANIMNAAWGGICSSDPVCVAVSLQPSRWTYKSILARKDFTISMATKEIMKEADFVGLVSGEKHDKFALTGLTAIKGEYVNAPYVDESAVVIECRLYKSMDLGAHTLFVGKIMDTKVKESCLDDEGLKPDLNKFSPLVFDMGTKSYYEIGQKLGQAFTNLKSFL